MPTFVKLRLRSGTSRGRYTHGWRTVSLFARTSFDGGEKRVAACNGGGYDMRGTVFGSYFARAFPDVLRAKIDRPFAGLTFHDPNFNPGDAKGEDGRTIAEREESGDSLGLERYQAFYSASSPLPTERHTIPSIDGACGYE